VSGYAVPLRMLYMITSEVIPLATLLTRNAQIRSEVEHNKTAIRALRKSGRLKVQVGGRGGRFGRGVGWLWWGQRNCYGVFATARLAGRQLLGPLARSLDGWLAGWLAGWVDVAGLAWPGPLYGAWVRFSWGNWGR